MLSDETQYHRDSYEAMIKRAMKAERARCETLIFLHKLTVRVGLNFYLSDAISKRLSVDDAIATIVRDQKNYSRGSLVGTHTCGEHGSAVYL